MADPTPAEVLGGLSNSATTTVNFTPRAAGTLLLLSVASDDYRVTSGTGTPENTGWTLLEGRQGNLGCYVWWKVATGAETSVQYRIGSNARSAYSLVAVDNVAASPLGVQNGSTSFISTGLARPQSVASVTPVAGERWCVVATAGTTGNVNGGPYTWTGYAKLSERYNTAGYRPGVTVGVTTVDGGSAVNGTVNFTASTEQFMSIVAAWKVAPDVGGGSTTGSGAALAQVGTSSGAGTVRATGLGSTAAPAATASGAGSTSAPSTTGSGSATGPAATATGSGTAATGGTGSASASSGSATGSGTASTTGTGSSTATPGTASGSGQVSMTGSGSATAPAGMASGTSATPTATGPGSATAPAGVAAGSGSPSTSGSGSATTATGDADGDGAVTTTGEGSAVAPAATADGSAGVIDPDQLPVVEVGTMQPARFTAAPALPTPTVTADAPRFVSGSPLPQRYTRRT